MECLEKLIWERFSRQELEQIQIGQPVEAVRKAVQENWDSVAKPLDGLGKLESITAQIGAIIGTDVLDIRKKAVIVMCSDNGIVEEGISQSGQEVTAIVAENMTRNQSSVCKMAERIGADVIPVDIGISQREKIPGVLDRKIRCGTRNFRKEPAMTEEETVRAIAAGMDMVFTCKQDGFQLLATGEMGIGNTTTSSAVTAAILKCDADRVTGRGAGLSDEKLLRKKQVIQDAIEQWHLYDADAFTILKTVGGLDLAGLVGVCIGGALYHIPIVLDGMISLTAALTAERMLPGTRAYLISSHKGKEPAVNMLLDALEMDAVIEADMALGEGTGAVMMMSLLDIALSVYSSRTTFSDIRIDQYERYEQL